MRISGLKTEHSYEEIRAVFLDLLAGREPTEYYDLQQYGYVSKNIAIVFQKRESPDLHKEWRARGDWPELSEPDLSLVSEVFWNLFLERIITLGINSGNSQYPFFRVSQ